jgi:photosystem II stability/assembly factor-like uncharacterized protein
VPQKIKFEILQRAAWTAVLAFTLLQVFPRVAPAQSWRKLAQMPSVINSGYFFDDSSGFVGGGHTTISIPIFIDRTTDGGNSWTQCSTPDGAQGSVSSFFFIDPLHGYASILVAGGTDPNRVWITSDGGASWNDLPSMGTGTATSIYGTSSALIITDLFSAGAVSTDGGQTFSSSLPSLSLGLGFLDDLNGIATNFGKPWQRTTDGGLSWIPVNNGHESWSVLPIRGTSSYLSASETNYLSVGNVTVIRRSDDLGQNWFDVDTFHFQTTGDIKSLGGSVFVQTCNETPSITGILRSTDLGKTWLDLGGPQNWFDSRFVVVPNRCGDQVIFAFDGSGGLYRYDQFSSGANSPLLTSTTQSFGSDTSLAAGSLARILVAWMPVQKSAVINEVEFNVHADPDVLTLEKCTPSAGWTLADTVSLAPGKIHYHLTAKTPITIQQASSIIAMDFFVSLGLSDDASIDVTDVIVDSVHTQSTSCGEAGAMAQVRRLPECGDSTIRLLMRKDLSQQMNLYPDPVLGGRDESIKVVVQSAEAGAVTWTITAESGEILASSNEWLAKGTSKRQFPIHDLSAGHYFLRFESFSGVIERKFVILK